MTAEALARMPHKGPMLLIAEIVETTDDRIVARARDHRNPAHPLRIDGTLHAPALVELGAQAAAAHASLHGIGGAHTGLLLALREAEVLRHDPDAASGPFTVTAERLAADASGARYRFRVSDGATDHLRGEALMSMTAAGGGDAP